MKECSVEGCEKAVIARGWCTTHYKRWSRNGHIKTDYYKGEGDDTEYFISMIKKNGACWEWQGSIDDKGYGHVPLRFKKKYKESLAHRVSYSIHNGELPRWEGYDSLCVMHTCDNPLCVNPEHLMLGTNSENMQDRDNKGRQIRGTRHHWSTLAEQDVLLIRSRLSNGESAVNLASEYNVCQATVYLIKNRTTWKHL